MELFKLSFYWPHECFVATSNDLCDDDGEQHECVNALRRCELFFNACTISDSYEFFILVCVCVLHGAAHIYSIKRIYKF
jgi:hypothetical protein